MAAASAVDTRARMGYTAPIGSTDQDRIRHLTVVLTPHYAARLFDAQEAGATEQQLKEIAASARSRWKIHRFQSIQRALPGSQGAGRAVCSTGPPGVVGHVATTKEIDVAVPGGGQGVSRCV